ncbi:MAG TPA: glutamyl-tRNA amidotransferase [Bacteroidales bacterium]|nr:MAG: glutamyl-tRNA amidotransferase [Bacteroidetes bacterium GWE2_42_24]OFY29233.1 MAG: glutamyl-tRNA amidotransferase [Bacteroidetes bacterium GWF2_43_11]HBZ66784.1 glutamyl-tRNA amidotransferase [Bacteroidales bacterium]
MSLEIIINNDIKAAMLARDKRKLEALRAIKAALLLEKTGKDTSGGEIPDEVEFKMLHKLVKQRRDTAEIYEHENRADLAEEERYQLSIIETYLPQQMSEEEILKHVKRIITELGATSVKDMGKVMQAASKELAGKADNKTISVAIKQTLGL